MTVVGVKLVGMNATTGEKVLFTVVLFVGIWVLRLLLSGIAQRISVATDNPRVRFWTRQAANVLATLAFLIGAISIWFDNPARLGTFMGLLSAGLAFALQKVVTAVAGYVVILRGKTFSVGDRITMGGVRGDVIALDFIQTTIMEMGEPAHVMGAAEPTWVRGRQFTGRIVTLNNGTIFDQPVYNYTRDFPYLWDELDIPIPYAADRARAEDILLAAARRHAITGETVGEDALENLRQRYNLHVADIEPRVFYRLTDNWVELGLRFIVPDHASRDRKDKMSREIVAEFERAKISIASGTYDIVGFPPIRLDERALSVIREDGRSAQPSESS